MMIWKRMITFHSMDNISKPKEWIMLMRLQLFKIKHNGLSVTNAVFQMGGSYQTDYCTTTSAASKRIIYIEISRKTHPNANINLIAFTKTYLVEVLPHFC